VSSIAYLSIIARSCFSLISVSNSVYRSAQTAHCTRALHASS